MRADEPYGLVVNEAYGLVHSHIGRKLREVGIRIDCDPCMSLSGGVADATDF